MTLPADDWAFIEKSMPITCVDVLPWFRTDRGRQVGLIKRKDEVGHLRWNLVGGRVQLNETLGAAVRRHAVETLGSRVSWKREDFNHPEVVEQYLRTPERGYGYDPRHHAIALSYILECEGEFEALGEAVDFRLFRLDDVPTHREIGFGQGPVVHELVRVVQAMPDVVDG